MIKLSRRRYLTFLVNLALTSQVLVGYEHTRNNMIPNSLRGHVTSFAGTFRISKDSIEEELARRSSQLTCQNDYKFSFDPEVLEKHNISSSDHMVVIAYVEYDFSNTFDESVRYHVAETLAVKEEYLWVFVPSIKVSENGERSLVFMVACFTDSTKDVFLPHFGDYIFRIDSLDFEDGVLKLQNGSDEMAVRMSYDPECLSVTDTQQEIWHGIRLEPMFSLSDPFKLEFCDKFTYYTQLCEELKQNTCKISRAKEDFCFVFDYIGPKIRCEASMEILDITGLFSKIPLLKSILTKTALEAEWIDGDRKIEMITPCLTNE